MKKKTVLLLGGTGAMGIYLIPELLNRGFNVYVTSRSKRESENENLHYIQGNAKDKEFLKVLLKKQSYDCIIDFMVYNTNEFLDRHQLLLESSHQYIFVSTYRVFSNMDQIITENTPRLLDVITDSEYLSTDEYALKKARQEDILRESKFDNWTIVRPSITYSQNRFQLGTLEADSVILRSIQNLPVAFPKELLEKQTTMTWAGDVAKMIGALVLNKLAYKEDYNVVTNRYCPWKDIIRVYEEAIGLDVILCELDIYISITGNKYPVIFDRMYNRVMDNSKIMEISKISSDNLTLPVTGLKSEISNFLDAPQNLFVNYSIQARMDKVTQSKFSLKGAPYKEKIKYYVKKIKFNV